MNIILKNSVIVAVFFILAILQNSFFPYVTILGITPNIVFIAFFMLIFFQKPQAYFEGIFIAIVAGIMTDMYSSFYFGAGIISLLIIYFFITLTRYFLQERHKTLLWLYFVPLFLISFIFYEFLFYLTTNFPHSIIPPNASVTELIYNFLIACVIFYAYQYISNRLAPRQLTLFN